MHNVERFCVNGNSVFRIDTTFEIIDGLWVTDTSYTNESIIKVDDQENPEFPGPMMVHFRKDEATYRRFAGELVTENPALLNVRKIGTDMDNALTNGIGSILSKADQLHVSERDAHRLDTLKASNQAKKRILSDIYGSQKDSLLQFGLADAIDEEDFEAKLNSLKDVWDDLVPGFHTWFKMRRSALFKETIITSALDRIRLNSRFFNNRLEVIHELQKKMLSEKEANSEVTQVITFLEEWMTSYDKEAIRAIYGQGKYRLSPGYDQFFVNPLKWFKWSEERKSNHIRAFFQFTPSSTDTFRKPASAGLKGNPNQKRRRGKVEPELFEDRLSPYNQAVMPLEPPSKKVTPLKLCRADEQDVWQSITQPHSLDASLSDEFDLDPLNPFRIEETEYRLVHRDDPKNCPKKVTRCESCKIKFSSPDVVLVRTRGKREFTNPKSGKQECRMGNFYLHYLKKCLEEYDTKFSFSAVKVLKETLDLLPAGSMIKLKKLGMKLV